MTYSNPCLFAEYPDWPYGRARTTARFSIESHPTRGERAVRTTLHPVTGRESTPKKLTYGLQARIVNGEDGRTYILRRTAHHIDVMQSNMEFQHEIIYSQDARYAATLALFR